MPIADLVRQPPKPPPNAPASASQAKAALSGQPMQTGPQAPNTPNPYSGAPNPAYQSSPQQPPSPLEQLLSGLGQQAGSAQTQEASSLNQLGLSQLLGQQGIQEQWGQGAESLVQQQQGLGNQQASLNLQEQYNPLYHLLQSMGYGLQEQGIHQQIGEAGNAREQQLKDFYGSEAASGALGTPGQKNQFGQIQYNYQQQLENLNRQLQQLGLTEKGSNAQYAEQTQQEHIQQQSLDNMAQQIGFNKGDLTNRINQAIDNLHLQGYATAGQIAQAYQDSLNGVYNNLSNLLPYIMQSGNIPNLNLNFLLGQNPAQMPVGAPS